MSQRGHIKMERADDTKNIKWFNEMKKRGYLPAMKTHRECTRGVFQWDFFDEWVDKMMTEAGIPPDPEDTKEPPAIPEAEAKKLEALVDGCFKKVPEEKAKELKEKCMVVDWEAKGLGLSGTTKIEEK